ncbi:MAG TPA: hypothetical protein VFG76_11235, partial [Candidatus Polarisedimenticolia bacterium]|nr:hypothetical protein [Candidatus Polarisedimenticolia bacterium]
MKASHTATLLLGAVLLGGASPRSSRSLSLEDRVDAQRAIEQVYYAHQIGSTGSFEDAVPR